MSRVTPLRKEELIMDSKTRDNDIKASTFLRISRFALRSTSVLCLLAMLFPLTACATTVRVKPPRPAVSVRVAHAPPAPRREVVAVRPTRHHVWVGGRWTWKSSRWVWVSGAWKVPPRGKRVWVAPKYERRGGDWIVVRGYWR